MFSNAISLVKRFHLKVNTFVGERLTRSPFNREWTDRTSEMLNTYAEIVAGVGDAIERTYNDYNRVLNIKDPRVLRAQLIIEEAAEVLKALAKQDEAELLHELADLSIVTIGTAVAFDLPIGEAFQEVMRANLTKDAKYGFDPARFKGPDFRPPNIVGVLQAHVLTGGDNSETI